MGIVSNAVLDAGGKTIGVIPRAMVSKGGEGQNLVPGARVVADNLNIYIHPLMKLTSLSHFRQRQ